VNISSVEDFLVSLLWRKEMWSLFNIAHSKRCIEKPGSVQAVWCFRKEEDAKALSALIAEAADGSNVAVWTEPVVGTDEHCAYIHVRTHSLQPVG